MIRLTTIYWLISKKKYTYKLKEHLFKDDFVVNFMFLIKMKLDKLSNYIKNDYIKNYEEYKKLRENKESENTIH